MRIVSETSVEKEILHRFLADAARLWGEERAEALRRDLEKSAEEIGLLRSLPVEREDVP